MGDPNNPLSLNRWSYTNANPVNWIDPSGRITEDENIQALIIDEDLRIRYNANVIVDRGYPNWIPGLSNYEADKRFLVCMFSPESAP